MSFYRFGQSHISWCTEETEGVQMPFTVNHWLIDQMDLGHKKQKRDWMWNRWTSAAGERLLSLRPQAERRLRSKVSRRLQLCRCPTERVHKQGCDWSPPVRGKPHICANIITLLGLLVMINPMFTIDYSAVYYHDLDWSFGLKQRY